VTTPPKTIDNLGSEVSAQYAQGQKLKDEVALTQYAAVGSKAQVDSRPYLPRSDFQRQYILSQTIRWAAFSPPPGSASSNKLFSFVIIPSLGDYEKQEDTADKLGSLENAFKESGRALSSAELRELKTLLSLFGCIGNLQKTLELINSRRNQYHRG